MKTKLLIELAVIFSILNVVFGAMIGISLLFPDLHKSETEDVKFCDEYANLKIKDLPVRCINFYLGPLLKSIEVDIRLPKPEIEAPSPTLL